MGDASYTVPASDRRALLAAVAVALATAVVFWPVLANGFIDLYDDGPYVLQNPAVKGGLGAGGIAWAMTAVHSHNWHPLTWISHMADVQLFGLDPWGHHLTSVLLHAMNAGLVVLLFVALGAPVGAALAAGGVFGLHPLRLESVAWVAERKDVLSGFFFLISLLAWTRNARRPSRSAYAVSLGAFALGLLAKPMVVTLPAILLLLDWWPLGRVRLAADPGARVAWKEELFRLAPFAVLSVAVAAITVLGQGASGSFVAALGLSLGQRIANAATSVFAYLGKMAWPASLAVYYPHPQQELLQPIPLLALGGVLAVTAGTMAAWRRAPWLLVGWGWYVVMLLPVLGILQVGNQAMADRYTYLPGLGILLAVTWTCTAGWSRSRSRAVRLVAGVVVAMVVVSLTFSTRAGIPAWRDSEALFVATRESTGRNALASNALGTIAAGRGQFDRAEHLFRESIAADPAFPVPWQNLAALLLQQGRIAEGFPVALEAVRLDPGNPKAHYAAGVAFEIQGRLPEAAAAYEEALRRMPEHAMARRRLAEVRSAMGPAPQFQGAQRP
ncbi:MAG: tetratricopeptide repeat protein [Anaeromyxobacteraceae bacterium]